MVVTNAQGMNEHEAGEWGEGWPMPATLSPMSAQRLDAHYRKFAPFAEDATAYPVDGDAMARAEAARCRAAIARVVMGARP